MGGFLSTLSLRRATPKLIFDIRKIIDFYPRSPCGERPGQNLINGIRLIISIHALLAESDLLTLSMAVILISFLSTLSLRRATLSSYSVKTMSVLFLSTLSLRRATWLRCWKLAARDISIHALLAESDVSFMLYDTSSLIFLSTLSLRRATMLIAYQSGRLLDFYPRSPCGERRYLINTYHRIFGISIHALLAESD